jgi:hypothetical protein
LKLIFVGFLPPGSHNQEERRFVELLSSYFEQTIVFQGIGIKGLGARQIGTLPNRLAKRNLPNASPRIEAGVLPMIPVRRGLGAKISSRLIRRRLTTAAGGNFQDWVFWTRFPSPELVEAIRGMEFGSIVYEPVDRYASGPWFSGREQARIRVAEKELEGRATVITSTAGLAQRFASAAGGHHALPIGKDARLKARKLPVLEQLPRPRLAVVGSLDWLADETLMVEVASRHPDWQIVLAGPRKDSWGRSLERFVNVHWLGKVGPEEARGVIAECDVTLNPCVLNDWTTGALPVKIFDYLAEGRPVVSTQMPELQIFADVVELTPRERFVEAIERALQFNSPADEAKRRAASDRYTLQERARLAFELVNVSSAESSSRCLA